MQPPRPTPLTGRPGRFLPPEIDWALNENISKFAIDFESFRAKNNEYVGFFGSKSNYRGQPSDNGPNQSDRPSRIDRIERVDLQSDNRVKTPHIVLQKSPEPYVGGKSVSVASNPFEKPEMPLPAVKVKVLKKPLANPLPVHSYPFSPHSVSVSPTGISKPPCPLRDEAIKELLRFSIIPNKPFDPRLLFRDFFSRYQPHHPLPITLANSFSQCPLLQRANIFQAISALACEVDDSQVEALLVFVGAFENDFLFLSVLKRILRRPFLRVSGAQLTQIAENLNRICASRRLQILLISFINKLD
jgi:hypothetical protein